MSRGLEPGVPEAVRRILEDEPERQVGLTILVLSELETGWPHLAMVSVGELTGLPDTALGCATAARPKSSTFTTPSCVTMMLAGFRSR